LSTYRVSFGIILDILHVEGFSIFHPNIFILRAQFRHMASKNHNSKDLKKAQGINNPIGPRLLTLKKAAEYLGLTVWAMRERIWSGQIPVIRFPGGRKLYVDVQDIEVFIERNKEVFL